MAAVHGIIMGSLVAINAVVTKAPTSQYAQLEVMISMLPAELRKAVG